MRSKAVDEYLGRLSSEKKAALERLRRAVRAAAPKAEECISYRMPAFRLNGKLLIAYAAAAKHCAFHAGAHPIRVHKSELKTFDTNKGTIRFQPDDPLPVALIRKLVKTRIAQHAAGAS